MDKKPGCGVIVAFSMCLLLIIVSSYLLFYTVFVIHDKTQLVSASKSIVSGALGCVDFGYMIYQSRHSGVGASIAAFSLNLILLVVSLGLLLYTLFVRQDRREIVLTCLLVLLTAISSFQMGRTVYKSYKARRDSGETDGAIDSGEGTGTKEP